MRNTGWLGLLSIVWLLLFLATPSWAAVISVDVQQVNGPVNQLVFGSAQPYGHGDVFLKDGSNALQPEAVSFATQLNPTILRFTGHSEAYFWEDGIGPQDQRPSPRPGQFQGFGFRYGTDEHMALCQSLEAEAFFTVNFGSGLVDGVFTPMAPLVDRVGRAASWVEYCNSPDDGQNPNGGIDWAARRAQNGHPEPYDVKFWEIGNEIYGEDVIGHVDVQKYAQELKVFSQAMKAVDPTIRIGAVGVLPPHGVIPWDHNDLEWNATLLEIAQQHIDFLVIHAHYPGSWNLPDNDRDLYIASMAGANQAIADMKELRQIIDRVAEHPIGIVPGENGLFVGLDDNYSLIASLLAGLHYADLLMQIVEQSSSLNLTFSCGWILHSWGLCGDIGYQFWPVRRWARPEYSAQKLVRQHMGQVLVESSVSCETFATPKAALVEAMPAVPELTVLSSIDSCGEKLSLIVLNKQIDHEVPAIIQFANFEPRPGVKLWTLNGSSLASNNEESPDAVAILSSSLTADSSGLSYNFPAHSLTAIELKRAEEQPIPPQLFDIEVLEVAGSSAKLVWATDRPADSRVEYGTISGHYDHVVEDTVLTAQHCVPLQALLPETQYFFRVASRDAQGLESSSTERTLLTDDITPPQIHRLKVVAITETTATITWSTDEPSDGRVEWRAQGEPWAMLAESSLSQEHILQLTGLLPATAHICRVCSADSAGNICQFVEESFTTASPRSAAGETGLSDLMPSEFQLWQNYPNPFNGSTCIRYQVPQGEEVAVRIYNSMGQLVQTLCEGFHDAGVYELSWDGRDDPGKEVASGIYLCCFQAGEYRQTRKMALVR